MLSGERPNAGGGIELIEVREAAVCELRTGSLKTKEWGMEKKGELIVVTHHCAWWGCLELTNGVRAIAGARSGAKQI